MVDTEETVEAMIRSMDEDHSLQNLGNINKAALALGNDGNPSAALRLLEYALAIYEDHYAANDYNFSVLIHNIGLELEAIGNFEAARVMFERAMEARERRFGPDSPELVGCLDALGRLSAGADWQGNDRISARRFFERALSIREKSAAAEDLEAADCLLRLAATYNHVVFDDNQNEKIRALKRALRIYENEYGQNSLEVAHVLLGHLVLASLPGDTREVSEYIHRAIAIFEASFNIQTVKAKLRTLYQDLCVESDDVAAFLHQQVDRIDRDIFEGI